MQSMTAFSRVEANQSSGHATWEIRSINHRYLDLSFRLPEPFRRFEPQWRELAKKSVIRGKVECNLTYKSLLDQSPDLMLDKHLVQKLIALTQGINQETGSNQALSAMDILRWPNVVVQKEALFDESFAGALLEEAFESLVQARLREGVSCLLVIEDKLDCIQKGVDRALELVPTLEHHFRHKINTRLNELKLELDPQRFEQELVLFLQRVDVTEELDRLQFHLKEVKAVVKQPGGIGRKLDFLMQELNREANTLSSKSLDPTLTQVAVEMKVAIEQMREQIQNVE